MLVKSGTRVHSASYPLWDGKMSTGGGYGYH